MAENKKKAFVNERQVPINIGGQKGTFTIPLILTDIDVGRYIEKQRAYLEQIKAANPDRAEGEERQFLDKHPVQSRFDWKKHIVKAVDFPGLTMKNFSNGQRPYFAIISLVDREIEPLIKDAFLDPNS